MLKLIWIIVPYLISCYISLALLKRFISINKSNHVETWLIPWFNLTLLLSTDVLLPWDIMSQGISAFKYLWSTTYSVQLLLCWLLLPCIISYHQLNYSIYSLHGMTKQLYGSLIQNLKFYTISGVILLLTFLFALMTLSIHSPWPIIVSLSHIYSLSFTLILLSMGLVVVPRDLYRKVFTKEPQMINSYYIALSRQNDELNDSKLYLLDHSINILHSSTLNNGDVEFNQLLTQCQDEVKLKLDQLNDEVINFNPNNLLNDDMFTQIKTIDKLNKEWNKFLTHFYTIQYHQYQIDKYIHYLAKQSPIGDTNDLNLPYTTTRSYFQIISKAFLTGITFIIFILSTLISVSVITLEILPQRFTQWIIWNHISSTRITIPLMIILIYNKIISLYAMTIIKFQNFHLIPNGHSNIINLFYFILYGNRLLFPLYFNLMTILPESLYIDTQFNHILYNQIKLIPLVNGLNKWLPPIFIIIITISYYNNKWKWKLLKKFISEDTLYQIFGWFNLDDYSEENGISTTESTMFDKTLGIEGLDNERLSITTNPNSTNTTNINDIEYSLQDGRFLFERAINTNNSNRYTDNNPNGNVDNNLELNETTTPASQPQTNLSDYFNDL